GISHDHPRWVCPHAMARRSAEVPLRSRARSPCRSPEHKSMWSPSNTARVSQTIPACTQTLAHFEASTDTTTSMPRSRPSMALERLLQQPHFGPGITLTGSHSRDARLVAQPDPAPRCPQPGTLPITYV